MVVGQRSFFLGERWIQFATVSPRVAVKHRAADAFGHQWRRSLSVTISC